MALNRNLEAIEEHKSYLDLSRETEDAMEIQRAFATLGKTYLDSADILHDQNQGEREKMIKRAGR
jgi:hypothetical protein